MSISPIPADRPALRHLLWAGPLTVVIAVVVNVILRAILVAVLQPSATFMPLTLPPIIFFTVFGVTAAVIVFALIGRFAPNPVRTYLIVAGGALLLSFLPDLLLLFGPPAPPPGAAGPGPMMLPGDITLPNVLGLMLMHVAAWAVTVSLLPRLTRAK